MKEAAPAVKPVKKIEIFQEKPASTEKFEIYQENPPVKTKQPFAIFQDEQPKAKEAKIGLVAPKFHIFQENKSDENSGPEAKPKRKSLKPIILDDDDPEAAKTMFVPSMEDFEKMANAASTPFTGRGFMPEEDENTCAVDVIFKKPTSLPPSRKSIATEEPSEVKDVPGPEAIPLSPIMESSREHYKSSSTSSSNQEQSHMTKVLFKTSLKNLGNGL